MDFNVNNLFRQYRTSNVWIFFIILINLANTEEQYKPCDAVEGQYGIMCKCTKDYCDTLYIPGLENEMEYVWITSSEAGDRFKYGYGSIYPQNGSIDAQNTLSIDQKTTYSRSDIIGFGGGWTGAVNYVLDKFSPKLRSHFYRSYFSSDVGIGYNVVRIPIGGTEFSLSPWTNDETINFTPDPTLSNFTALDPRDILQNNQLKEMQQETGNSDIRFIGAIWSPPLWMKAMHEYYGPADNQVIPDYYQALANYHARWLNLTIDDDIPIWGLSTGNEPYYAVYYPYDAEGCSWNASDQADWIVDYFVPAIKQTGHDININIFDDMRNIAVDYLKNMTDRQPDLMDYTGLIAIHPYLDDVTSPTILNTIHETYDKQILYTEMSFGALDKPMGVTNGSWGRAEELIMILMESLQHDVTGYVDWNVILDSNGGPSYVNASYDAYIHASYDFKAFYKQPVYYAMAHFAKFIPRHSLRINTTFSGPSETLVQTLAYLTPDNQITVILYNNDTNIVQVSLNDPLMGGIQTLSLQPKSLNTFIYSNE